MELGSLGICTPSDIATATSAIVLAEEVVHRLLNLDLFQGRALRLHHLPLLVGQA